MINLKQPSTGVLAVSKSKSNRKEVSGGVPTPPSPTKRKNPSRPNGLTIARVFSRPDVRPFDEIEWDQRTAEITDETGKTIFKQENVEVPKNWSILATKVVVSKYFYGENGTSEREHSVQQLVGRVTRTIADWGQAQGYCATAKDAEVFCDELTWLCVNQYGSFNSPVWFNCGLYHQYFFLVDINIPDY